MNVEAITQAPVAVKIHLATVLPAFAGGAWQIFLSTKGSRFHRSLGGDISGHGWAMLRRYFGGLLIAGTLALMPGRIMHRILFG